MSLNLIISEFPLSEILLYQYLMQYIMSSFLQLYTFQVAIVTDGATTFAAFIYKDPCRIRSGFPMNSVIGFNKGDRRRLSNIMHASVEGTNLYRIDGKLHIPVYCSVP